MTFPFRLVAYVALGGAAGSVARWLAAELARPQHGPPHLLATLAVNLVGSFVIGVFMPVLDSTARPDALRALFVTGFCGGFTTFSTFSAETVTLLTTGRLARAGGYVFASVGLCVLGTLLGLAVGRRLSSV